MPTRQTLIATTGEHGISATITPSSGDHPGVLLLSMSNEKYHAMVSRILTPEIRIVNRLDQFSDGYRNEGFGGILGDEIWIDRAIRAETSRGFLLNSVFDLKKYIEEWKSSRASLECLESDSSERPHKLKFSGLSGEVFNDVEYCEFLIDTATFLVVGGRCVSIQGVHAFGVKSFAAIDGTSFPTEINSSFMGTDAVERCYNTIARFQPLDSVGFKKEQLYLSYYGLAEPNAEAIAKPKRYTGFVYLAIGVSLGLVCAFLYWRKTR
jgi:hypothetical protein